MIRHVFRRAGRSLWENVYLNVVATGVIASALLLLGVFLTIQYNLSAIIDSWDRDVHVSAYFEPQITESARFAARDRIAAMPGVQEVRYVSEADAKAWLLQEVGGLEEVLDQVGGDALPASLEITLTDEQAKEPSAIAGFAKSLASPEFQDVDFGQQWVERFNAFLSLLQLLAAILGSLIALAAIFLVANTVDLIVFNRKAELENRAARRRDAGVHRVAVRARGTAAGRARIVLRGGRARARAPAPRDAAPGSARSRDRRPAGVPARRVPARSRRRRRGRGEPRFGRRGVPLPRESPVIVLRLLLASALLARAEVPEGARPLSPEERAARHADAPAELRPIAPPGVAPVGVAPVGSPRWGQIPARRSRTCAARSAGSSTS